jgi:ribonuclease HI
MPWRRFDFRGDEVWVRVLDTGKPIVRRGLAELRYRQGARKSYRTQPENLEELEDGTILSDADFTGDEAPATNATALREDPSAPPDASTIIIHTDGACSGNPGPAGIGVHLVAPARMIEISEYMGEATNNAAELHAIARALEELDDAERQAAIHLYTDSAWSLGVLVGGWKYKTNLAAI